MFFLKAKVYVMYQTSDNKPVRSTECLLNSLSKMLRIQFWKKEKLEFDYKCYSEL